MAKLKKRSIRPSAFGMKVSRNPVTFLVLWLLLVFCFPGCTSQMVPGERDVKGIVKEEPQRKAPGSPMPRNLETAPAHREDRRGSSEKERIGRELEQAVVELKENVANLKKKLDEEVAVNMASFKKDPPEYKIRSGDIIEIIYHMLYEENPAEYLLEVQDSVKIEFFNQPELNRVVTVRSDGKVTLPIVGDFPASGLSTSQLEQEVIQGYKKYLINPIVTITLEKFNVKIDELKKRLPPPPGGRVKFLRFALMAVPPSLLSGMLKWLV